jgi:hypothetical protein
VRRGIIDRMRFRKLRIAWSVAGGVVAALLCVLWVRSYGHLDRVDLPTGRFGRGWVVVVASIDGLLISGVENKANSPSRFKIRSGSSDEIRMERTDDRQLGFKLIQGSDERAVQLPFWFVVAATWICAIIPSIRWSTRFSLRTLLIVTTLVAAILGAIVWAVK